MNRSEVKEKLKAHCMERYLSRSDSDYFRAPEHYSPLYRQLYEHLVAGLTPPHLGDPTEWVIEDIEACNTTFDRYLTALYPSRYEASNPFRLPDEALTESKLVGYLCSEYKKSSADKESYKIEREIDSILNLIDSESATRLRPLARSGIFKLLTLSYKLASINEHWKKLIRAYDENPESASMDNIVDFNMLDNDIARRNTALVKMFYYELDQGKDDGDSTHSRRVSLLPYFYRHLNLNLKHFFMMNMLALPGMAGCIQAANIAAARFQEQFEVVDVPLVYDDANRELFDLIQGAVLKNIQLNNLLARQSFESQSEVMECVPGPWVFEYEDNEQRAKHVEALLKLPAGKITSKHFVLSEVLLKLFKAECTVLIYEPALVRNLILVIIAQCEFNPPVVLKSKIQGAKHNQFNPLKELQRAQTMLVEHPERYDNQHILSVIRPTCLHYFSEQYEKLLFAVMCPALDFKQYQALYYNTLIKMQLQLKHKNHCTSLRVINGFCQIITAGQSGDLDLAFVRDLQDDAVFQKLRQREVLEWTPLDDMAKA